MQIALAALLAFIVGVALAPLGIEAQPPEKVPRIGFLAAPGRSVGTPLRDSFLQGLRELGWLEGKDVVIEYRWAEGSADLLAERAAELVRLRVDLIFAASTAVTVAVKKATSTIPIVSPTMSSPVELGLIASVARPGGNVTGLSYSVGREIFSKQLGLLKEAVPKVRRVAILSNPANPSHEGVVRDLKVGARSLGMQLQLLEARGPQEFDGAFAAMSNERVGGLLLLSDPIFDNHGTRLVELARKSRLPTMYGMRAHPELGGLMSYGIDIRDNFRRAASYVDKILKGAKPAELPVEQPTKFEFVINLKTAELLGLKIPQTLLLQANQLID
jgi:putative tryptophan/tyrosine transport system substrate-binding protein